MPDLETTFDQEIAPVIHHLEALIRKYAMPFAILVQFSDDSFFETWALPEDCIGPLRDVRTIMEIDELRSIQARYQEDGM